MLSERSQKRKSIQCFIPFIEHSRKCILSTEARADQCLFGDWEGGNMKTQEETLGMVLLELENNVLQAGPF